jgi:hypothetical protein
MIIKKIISTFLLLMFILTMSGAPLIVHRCCGEVESISLTLDHEDACCEMSFSQLSIDATACCGDELIETAMKVEGIPHTISILFISPLIKLLDGRDLYTHPFKKDAFQLISFLHFPSSSSIFLDREDICIFRI